MTNKNADHLIDFDEKIVLEKAQQLYLKEAIRGPSGVILPYDNIGPARQELWTEKAFKLLFLDKLQNTAYLKWKKHLVGDLDDVK